MLSPDFLGPKLLNIFSCSTHLSTKFQLLITTKMLKKDFSCFQTLKCVIYHANMVKMPTIVCMLAFMSMIKFMISLVEQGKSFITSGPNVVI